MPAFQSVVHITLKTEVLDPAGQATERVLKQMGYPVDDVRLGKEIRMTVQAEDAESAQQMALEMAQRILANPVMEQYTVTVVPV